jgi:copper chaperone NosL
VKPLAMALLAMLVVGSLVVLVRPAPRSGPEPVRYGRDACARCRMLLSEPGFAGEIRDARGNLARYDDLGCLLGALREAHTQTQAWVEDHRSRALVPLLSAALVAGGSVRTPMGHGIVAFADAQDARAFAEERGARVVPLEELLRTPGPIARAAHQEGSAHR